MRVAYLDRDLISKYIRGVPVGTKAKRSSIEEYLAVTMAYSDETYGDPGDGYGADACFINSCKFRLVYRCLFKNKLRVAMLDKSEIDRVMSGAAAHRQKEIVYKAYRHIDKLLRSRGCDSCHAKFEEVLNVFHDKVISPDRGQIIFRILFGAENDK
jgi:hypothetical protein